MATVVQLKATEEKSKYSHNTPVEQKFKNVPSLCSIRYGIAFITHFCNFTLKAQAVLMNITMVAMVNSTDHQSQFNDSAQRLPVDSFNDASNNPMSLPEKVSVYNWSPQIQGILFASVNYGMILTLAPSGYLAGRIGTKQVVGVALLGSSLLTLFTPLAADLGLVYLITIRVIQGLTQGAALGGQFALWEKWGPPHERSRLCTIAISGMVLGISVAILLGGIISQSLGWPFAFYIFGGIGFVCCIFWFVMVYDDPASHPWISIAEKEYITSFIAPQVHSPLPVKAVLRSLPFWSMCLCGFTHHWLTNILIAYTPTYISSVFTVNIRENGFLSALPFILAWIIGILGGQLADFLLTKNFKLVTVRKLVTFLGTFPPSILLVALPYLSFSYVMTITLLTIACGLCPFCQSGVYINALDIAPRHSSFLTGVLRGFAQVAAIIAPTLCGFILNQDHEYGWKKVFWSLFAVSLSGLIVFLIFGKADVQDWAKEKQLTRL